MSKYFVVHGSVSLDGKSPVGVGAMVELEESKAALLVATGFLLDEKSFAARKKGLEGMVESGGVLAHKDTKLAKGLGLMKPKPEQKPEPKPEQKEKK